MSRSYRVKVRETLRRVIKAEDHVRSQLELLEILPADQMAELLATELARRGFQRKGEVLVRQQGAVAVSVELATGNVTIRTTTEKQLALEAESEGRFYNDAAPGRDETKRRMAEQLREKLEQDAQQHGRKLQTEATDRLERELGDIAVELDQAVNRATAEALKRKAAQMGRIKHVADDPQNGALTIVVEL